MKGIKVVAWEEHSLTDICTLTRKADPSLETVAKSVRSKSERLIDHFARSALRVSSLKHERVYI